MSREQAACCAHLTVLYTAKEIAPSCYQERWLCQSCNTEFTAKIERDKWKALADRLATALRSLDCANKQGPALTEYEAATKGKQS